LSVNVNQTINSKGRTIATASAKLPTGAGHHAPFGLRTVAIFEFAKGMLVLIAGLGLLSLVHRDAQQVAEEIVRRLHLNPARQYPRIFIDSAGNLNDARLWFLSVAALIYSAVRFVETFGLWHERPWAEWFAVISASLYLPVELYHLYEKPGLLSVLVPLVNIGIVIYLAILLAANARRKSGCDSST
jgi:uncharacterized membrane protein (DUF2068 family)